MTDTASDPVLAVRDLRTFFRIEGQLVKAVDGVSFDVHRGQTLAIVGESGSGKSVACLSALRLLPSPPAFHPSGAILHGGRDLLALADREVERLRGDRLAMIFQDPLSALNPYLTVARQLTEVLEVHRHTAPAVARREAIAMLERVGIPDAARRIDHHPHQFSGGMRQRVMIAMALLCRPEVLFADEPTTALDVTIQAQILALIADLRRELGMAVVLVTHDLGIVAGTADRVAVMYAGRIVEEGTVEEIFTRPVHPYTRGLLASTPRIDTPTRGRLAAIPGLPPDPAHLPVGCPFHPRCDRAVDRCRRSVPELLAFTAGHRAACPEAETHP